MYCTAKDLSILERKKKKDAFVFVIIRFIEKYANIIIFILLKLNGTNIIAVEE